jgi:hypothetical protein
MKPHDENEQVKQQHKPRRNHASLISELDDGPLNEDLDSKPHGSKHPPSEIEQRGLRGWAINRLDIEPVSILEGEVVIL